MSPEFCRGCGVVLQTKDPDQAGYRPATVRDAKGPLVCQRCYQMIHYGKAGIIRPPVAQIDQSIDRAIKVSQLLVVVADFTDLTGSLPVWQQRLADRPYLLVLNKADLAPGRTPLAELQDYLRGYLKRAGWTVPKAIIITSVLQGQGLTALRRQLQQTLAPQERIAFLGVTNVGKSSLIRALLQAEDAGVGPTIAKFPGTTLGLSNWGILQGRNTVSDTPGLTPGDRVADRLCPDCASRILMTVKLEQKLWGLKPSQGLILGGLVGLENQSGAITTLISFTAPQFGAHRTLNAKLPGLLEAAPTWLAKICPDCHHKLNWERTKLRLESGQDLAIAGLGWVSLRGSGADFEMTLPGGIRWEVRPALIGKRSSERQEKLT